MGLQFPRSGPRPIGIYVLLDGCDAPEITIYDRPTETEEGSLIRDCAAIRIIPAGEGVDLRDQKHQQACYIDVEGVDDLYRELKPKLDMLPKGRVKLPFEQAYGQREFHVLDEDALLIMFGEPVSK